MNQQRHLKALELNKILELCSEKAICDQSKDEIRTIVPADTFSLAKHLLDQTDTASRLTVKFGNPSIHNVMPCESIVSRAKLSATLSTRELLDIGALLRCARTLSNWYQSATMDRTILDNLFESLSANHHLEKDIERCIISEDEIADNASSELYNIRRNIRNANQKARDTLEKMTRSTNYQKYLQEQIITMRNGRFVIPVRLEHRNEVKGIVHDTSASGSTLFVEPMAVVELNNQIRELEVSQKNEIDKILLELSGEVANDADNLMSNYDAIIQIDVVFAKCKLGDSMKAITPQLVDTGETILGDARHPLINRDLVVPINISIGKDFDTLVITGPNTGGKTVALKTLGLLTLMSLSGFMIPASSRSKVSFYRNILADIGDEQSIEQNLSTFSGHMTNIVSILKQADDSSLILIDELGAGTDPVEGAALAVAIISKLREKKAYIVATTHYAEMKIFALQTLGVENASCEFDVATLRPTYRLLIGTPGRSNAFAIGQKLGISSDIITMAEGLVSTENHRFEDVVSSLEAARYSLEQEKKQAQALRQQAASAKKTATMQSQDIKNQQENILKETRDRARSMLEQVRYQSDKILDELEELKKQKDKENFSQTFGNSQKNIRGLISAIENIANPVIETQSNYTLPRPLKLGDVVHLLDFNTEGTVIALPDNKGYLTVRAGIIETKVSINAIKLMDQSKVKFNGGKISTKQSKAQGSTAATGKLDLRGFDSNEAELELARFIDRASLRHLKTLTIVHGKGTGVLRKMVNQKLKANKHVESYRLGDYGEGGDGVTMVEMK